jgi:hypothetical protein
LDEGGDPVVQLVDPVEAAVAAGHDGDLRVRHEAAPGASLRGGEQGAAHAGDQQGRHGDRAEFALAIAPLVKNSGAVLDVVAAQLRAAQAAGDTPVNLDPDLEALSLIAMSAGLATSVLAGQSSIEQAQAVIDYHLDRLFPPSRPA